MVPVAAKAGALLAVAAAGSTSIWYFSDSIFGTSLVSIADENPATTYENKSIGKNYSKYFLSSKNNKKTWENRYEEHKNRFANGSANNKAKDKFSTVDSAFSTEAETNNTKSLNKICEDAYKENNTSNLEDTESTDANKFFKTNVWEFCGLGKIVTLDKEPKNGQEGTTYSAEKIGGDTNNNKLFVSTKVDSNDWFWNLKTEEFWANTENIAGKEQTNNEFKKLSGNEDSKKNNKSIKETCQAIYEKTSANENGSKNKEDAEKFCSIKLTLPT